MKITDHGQWLLYEPDPHPFPHLAQRIMFCRREVDQRDWYLFQKELVNDNIKMTVKQIPGGWVVHATERDPSLLFPAGMKLLEIDDAVGAHELYRQRVFNGREFLDRPTALDDKHLGEIANKFGWDLRAIFDNVRRKR